MVDHFATLQQFVAYRAICIAGVTVLGVGGFLCIPNFCNMPLGRDNFLCNKNLIADGAVFTLSLAGCGAGSCNSFVDDLGMSLGGNSRAGAYFLAAILAVGVAGVAGLGAGCVLRVADFGIFMIAGLGSSPHTV